MSEVCVYPGNTDLYGAGIRYGIYMQWIAAQIAVFSNLEDKADIVIAYLIFSLAMMSALFALTTKTSIPVIDAVIMLHLFFGGIVCVPEEARFQLKPKLRAVADWRSIIALILWTIMSGFSSWFWISGWRTTSFESSSCGTTLFLFTKISPNAFDKLAMLFGTVSILAFIVNMWKVVYAIAENIEHSEHEYAIARKILELVGDRPQDELHRQRRDNADSDTLRVISKALMVLLPISLVYFPVAIELMLRWNDVTDVYSVSLTGQLIPLVIGAAGLVKTFYDLFYKLRKG